MSTPALSRPGTRATITLVSHQRLWPSSRVHPGLAHGWQGAAWVAFKLAGAGAPVAERVFVAAGRHLDVELERAPHAGYLGALIGCAADAVIAAYVARQGIASTAVARRACRRVVAASRRSAAWDVHLGLAGALLAFAEISAVEPAALRDFQPARLVDRLLTKLDALCALPPHGWQTGMAHGPAGAIVALETCGALGWCRLTARRRQRWLDALAKSAVAGEGGALYWPTIAGRTALGLQSWCAGTPGIALALLQCFRLTREPVYLEFARGALEGMKALSRKPFFSQTLCCGSAGYQHIFLEAYRVTGEAVWLEHAAHDARVSPPSPSARSARSALSAPSARSAPSGGPRPRLGLLQGELGIAYLADRLARPLAYPLPALGASSA